MRNVIAFNFSDESISVMNDGVLALSNFVTEEKLGSCTCDTLRILPNLNMFRMFVKNMLNKTLMFKWYKSVVGKG